MTDGDTLIAIISLEQENAVIDAAFTKGAELGLQPPSAVVLDSGSHPIAFKRRDGASTLRLAIAAGKARGALALGVSSRKVADIAADRTSFIASLGPISPLGIVPEAGKVIITDGTGRPIGSVGTLVNGIHSGMTLRPQHQSEPLVSTFRATAGRPPCQA